MKQTIADFRAVLWPVLRFGLWVLLVSVPASLLISWWFPFSWWKAFRRCVSIGAAVSLWLTLKSQKRSLRSYGFFNWRAGKRQFSFGVLLGVGTLVFLFGLYLTSGVCQLKLTDDHVKFWRTILGFIPAAVLVGVLEEAVFRGFLLQQLLHYSRPLALILSSALYAVVHLKQPHFTPTTWLELGGLFLLGNLLALTFLLTQQLYLAVGLHAALAYMARVNKLVVSFPDTSISWLVGTSRLVNGVVSWAVLLGLAAIIIWWTRASRRGGACHEEA